jgi:hypothetical protein
MIERERPGVADRVVDSEHTSLCGIGCVLDHVQPVRIALVARAVELRV